MADARRILFLSEGEDMDTRIETQGLRETVAAQDELIALLRRELVATIKGRDEWFAMYAKTNLGLESAELRVMMLKNDCEVYQRAMRNAEKERDEWIEAYERVARQLKKIDPMKIEVPIEHQHRHVEIHAPESIL